MNYLKNTLMSDEKVVYYIKPHWIIFFPVAIWIVIFLLIIIYGNRFELTNIVIFNEPVYLWLALCAFLIAIFHLISAYIFYISAEYAITDKRVLMKVGIICRNSLEIFLQKIESIHVDQSILGRILNYGSVIICGTGGSKDPFSYIPQPLQFRKLVQQQIEQILMYSKE